MGPSSSALELLLRKRLADVIIGLATTGAGESTTDTDGAAAVPSFGCLFICLTILATTDGLLDGLAVAAVARGAADVVVTSGARRDVDDGGMLGVRERARLFSALTTPPPPPPTPEAPCVDRSFDLAVLRVSDWLS